jgi:enamine deaminase RidA (YjgF/YER057c/UK114 family)
MKVLVERRRRQYNQNRRRRGLGCRPLRREFAVQALERIADRGDYRVHMLTLDGHEDGRMAATRWLERLDEARKQSEALGGAIVGQLVCGPEPLAEPVREILHNPDRPLTFLCAEDETAGCSPGCQITVITGAPVQPLRLDGRPYGGVVDTPLATSCRLGNVGSTESLQDRGRRARNAFERAAALLRLAGLDARDMVRTWVFLGDILSWYGDFNSVRTEFFRQAGVLDGLVPASTAVGMRGGCRRDPAIDVWAIRPKSEQVSFEAVSSPLQGSARDYGSAFSRAVEVRWPGQRELWISGTAGIGPDGESQFVGDVQRQIHRTLDVVEAILESRHMDWRHTTRAIAYFRRSADLPAWRQCCQSRGIHGEAVPTLLAQGTICRDELLFELELDAACGA